MVEGLPMNWFVYILKCGNGSYYIGHTQDLTMRCARHVSKTGARHTAQNGVAGLLYHETIASEIDAIHRERQIKRWCRAKKAALLAGNMNQLHHLSRSHD